MLRCVCCKVDKILCQIVVSEMVNIHVDKLGQFRVHGHSDMQHKQPGRCEFGSFFETQRNEFLQKSQDTIKQRGGDKWSFIIPWDENSSVNTIVDINIGVSQPPINFKTAFCMSKEPGRTIGILFPVRGNPDNIQVRMGKAFDSLEVVATPQVETFGLKQEVPIFAFKATFYSANKVIGVADILPNISVDNTNNTVSYYGFRATPARGGIWLGEAGNEMITVSERDSSACLDGDYAPWSQDTPSLLEICIMKLYKSM